MKVSKLIEDIEVALSESHDNSIVEWRVDVGDRNRVTPDNLEDAIASPLFDLVFGRGALDDLARKDYESYDKALEQMRDWLRSSETKKLIMSFSELPFFTDGDDY